MHCIAEEHLAELMPIFDELRAKGEVGNALPMQVGSTTCPTVYTRSSTAANYNYRVKLHSIIYVCYLLW